MRGLIKKIFRAFGFAKDKKALNLDVVGRKSNILNKSVDIDGEELAIEIILALGGISNIECLEACMTRLRIITKETKMINEEGLKYLGATGIVRYDREFQLVFGIKSWKLCDQIKGIINGKETNSVFRNNKLCNIEKGHDMGIEIAMPVSGELIPLEDVPDDIFSLKLLGDGFAIKPSDQVLYSPIKGKIIAILPNKHCITLRDNKGIDIFIHIGIDTLNFNEESFEIFVEVGDYVDYGQPLIKFPLELMIRKAKSTLIPIIFRNLEEDQYVYFDVYSKVIAKEIGIVKIHEKSRQCLTI